MKEANSRLVQVLVHSKKKMVIAIKVKEKYAEQIAISNTYRSHFHTKTDFFLVVSKRKDHINKKWNKKLIKIQK